MKSKRIRCTAKRGDGKPCVADANVIDDELGGHLCTTHFIKAILKVKRRPPLRSQ